MNGILLSTKKVISSKPINIILIVYVIFASVFIKQFATVANIKVVLQQSTDIGLLACGMTFVMLNKGIDFSIVAVTGLSSVIGAMIMNTQTGLIPTSPFGFIVGTIVMVLIGVGIGTLNAVSVVKFKIPSFIGTMSTQMIFLGLSLYITESKTFVDLPKEFLFLGEGFTPVIITLTVFAIMHYILTYTAYGRKIYATGTNPDAAKISGIPVKRILFSLFVLSGFCAGLASVVMSARMGVGKPSLGSESLLDVITAVTIGGTNIFGGEGTMIGTLIGVIFIAIINSSLSLASIPWYIIVITKGIILFGLAIFYAVQRKKEN